MKDRGSGPRARLLVVAALSILCCSRGEEAAPPAWTPGLADGSPHSQVDAAAPEALPGEAPLPGAKAAPIAVTELPFLFVGETTDAPEALVDSYGCDPARCLQGGEIHFELDIGAASIVTARVTTARDGIDAHVHLLSSDEPGDCLEAGPEIERPLPPGRYRLVLDVAGGPGGVVVVEATAEPPRPRPLGKVWNTYYILADESRHEGPRDTPVFDASCRKIATVRQGFHDSACIQGSGVLLDGQVINYASTCTRTCPRAKRCGQYPYRVCWKALDRDRYPWGMGKDPRPLVPDWSIAVDPEVVPLDTVVYVEEMDGVTPPTKSAPHDGCFGATDTGGAIRGNHFDFFVGSRDRWIGWEALFPTRSWLHAWVDHPRCLGYTLGPDRDISVPRSRGNEVSSAR